MQVMSNALSPMGKSGFRPQSDSYRDLIIASNPVAYWRLGETTGIVAYDEVGNENGQYDGGVTLGSPGALFSDSNSCVDLDGSTGNIEVLSNDVFNGDNLTVSGWMNIASAGDYQYLAARDSSVRCWDLGVTSDMRIYAVLWNNNGALKELAGPPVSIETWHHIALTYDGTIAKTYLDGVSVGSIALPGNTRGGVANIALGSQSASSGFLTGRIDEVVIHNYALTASDILAQYNKGAGIS